MSNLIFVVGSPRSGTSYLSRALGLAEDACYLGESALFCLCGARAARRYYAKTMLPKEVFPYSRPVMLLLRVVDRVRKKDRIRNIVEHLLLMSKVKDYDLKPSDTLFKVKGIQLNEEDQKELLALVRMLKLELAKEGFRGFAESYVNEYAVRKGCGTVVEKTPAHLRFLPVIHNLFPEAKVILIRRDKKRCLESYFRTFGPGPGILRHFPVFLARKVMWKQLMADEERERWAVEQSWVRKVEFDEFVQEPCEVIASLVDWLGLEYNFEKYSSYFPEYKPSAGLPSL